MIAKIAVLIGLGLLVVAPWVLSSKRGSSRGDSGSDPTEATGADSWVNDHSGSDSHHDGGGHG